jgi:alpha-beta hydrolase superfamily lysophospholipase
MRTTDLGFTAADGVRLLGTLHLPDRGSAPLVIGCHGLLSDRRSLKQVAIANACCREGIPYFRFDHRGCGDSAGVLERDTSLETRCLDLLGAIHHLRLRTDVAQPFGLFGSSMGGAVCLHAAARTAVGPLVTFAAPVRSSPLLAFASTPGLPYLMRRMAAVLREPFDLAPDLPKLHNLLVVHGDADSIVPAAHAREIHSAAGAPKRLVLQPGGDHLMSDPRHQQAFAREALAWIKKGFAAAQSDSTGMPPT